MYIFSVGFAALYIVCVKARTFLEGSCRMKVVVMRGARFFSCFSVGVDCLRRYIYIYVVETPRTIRGTSFFFLSSESCCHIGKLLCSEAEVSFFRLHFYTLWEGIHFVASEMHEMEL